MIEQPPLFEIPRGWREEKCSCGSRLWKVPHPTTGNKQPLAIATAHNAVGTYAYAGETLFVSAAAAPTKSDCGYGWNHFRDCPDREKFRRKTLGTTNTGEQIPSLSRKGLVVVAQAIESLAHGLTNTTPDVAYDLLQWAHALRYGHHPSEGRCDPSTCDGQEAAKDEALERRHFRVVSNTEIQARLRTMYEACSADGREMVIQTHGAITLAFRLGVLTETEVMTWRKALDTCPGHGASQVWCAYCGPITAASVEQGDVANLVLPEGFSL